MKRIIFIFPLIALMLLGCEGHTNPSSSLPADSQQGVTNEPSVSRPGNSLPGNSLGGNLSISSGQGNYYDNIAAGATGSTLKTALTRLINPHTKLNYDNLEEYMRTADRDWTLSPDPEDANPYMHLLYYTKNDDASLRQTWNKYHSSKNPTPADQQMWDKEHIWAKSNGFPSSGQPAYSDLHHLRASDMKNNNTRSNLPFGAIQGSATNVNDFSGTPSGKKGKSSGVSVYEPRDADKGDVARALLYMATCYGESIHLTLTDGTESSGGKWGFLSTLLKWHYEDLPDAFEINRNNIVYSLQRNRNPFIDNPSYACSIYNHMSPSSNVSAVCATYE